MTNTERKDSEKGALRLLDLEIFSICLEWVDEEVSNLDQRKLNLYFTLLKLPLRNCTMGKLPRLPLQDKDSVQSVMEKADLTQTLLRYVLAAMGKE
jgi:hypothetical protein